jgi:hypothetical protein
MKLGITEKQTNRKTDKQKNRKADKQKNNKIRNYGETEDRKTMTLGIT